MFGHGASSMSLEEARMKLCAQARLMGRECNPSLLGEHVTHVSRHHGGETGSHEDVIAQQSKDAIVYVTIVVVFYVAIVLLLIGTNLRAGGAGRGARFKKHVVEYSEGRAENRLVPSRSGSLHHPACSQTNNDSNGYVEEDIADV